MDCGHLNLDVGLYQATLSACTPLLEGRDRCVDGCPSPALPSASPHSATPSVLLWVNLGAANKVKVEESSPTWGLWF